jgi:cysteine desulfurase
MTTSLYFDYAASAPRRPEVLEAMAPWLTGVVGNPSGTHHESRRARLAIDDARDVVAEFVGARDGGDVVFTGGGTESIYLALAGVVRLHARQHPLSEIVLSTVEHSATKAAAEALAEDLPTVRLRWVDVDADGRLKSSSLQEALSTATAIVSIMTVNNETGAYQPLPIVGMMAKGNVPGGAVTHTDAVAAAPHLYLPAVTDGMDLVSIAAHKLGGPVNAGALVFRDDVPFVSPLRGGDQERGRRGGTVDVAAAVGLAAACRAVAAERETAFVHLDEVRQVLENGLRLLPGAAVTSAQAERAPGFTHVTFEGLASEEVLFLLDERGICASGGSSCASGATTASPVLEAMGMDPRRARGAVRFTYGPDTTIADMHELLKVTAGVVHHLRGER